MQKCPTDIGVTLTAPHEQQGRCRIDHDADRRHYHHRQPHHRGRLTKPVDCLPENGPTRRQEQHGIGEGGVDRCPPQAEGKSPRGWPPGQHACPPGQQQANHIAGIVAGIGNQRE